MVEKQRLDRVARKVQGRMVQLTSNYEAGYYTLKLELMCRGPAWMIIDVCAQSGEYSPVEFIHLAVLLRVVCRLERVVNVEDGTNIEEYFGCELFSVVRDEVCR